MSGCTTNRRDLNPTSRESLPSAELPHQDETQARALVKQWIEMPPEKILRGVSTQEVLRKRLSLFLTGVALEEAVDRFLPYLQKATGFMDRNRVKDIQLDTTPSGIEAEVHYLNLEGEYLNPPEGPLLSLTLSLKKTPSGWKIDRF